MIFKNIRKKLNKNLLVSEIAILLLIISIGAIVFHIIEGWSVLDSFYFIITATSTVGFGDITPKTEAGKILFMFYTAIGIPFFISIGGLLLETRFKSNIEKYIRRVHAEVHETEEEVQKIERSIKKVYIAEDRIENLEKEMRNIEKDNNTIMTYETKTSRRRRKIF